ncbi:hypothetical protein F2Q69_00022324 [Brassica cretica]|uniref:Uncharacterized protein n=1 Tax=Brassica cretica TaxID=69181 RepID=A0A8S9Q373_BRACR|nr:hypothetical protein F2Q69_00022324 [Brassica cretica]
MLPEGDSTNSQTDQAQIGGVPAAVVDQTPPLTDLTALMDIMQSLVKLLNLQDAAMSIGM